MGGLSPLHLILILGIALLVIGPGKLPETGAALGKAIRSFREAADGSSHDAPPAPQPTTPPPTPAAPQPVPPATGTEGEQTPPTA